MAFWLVVSAVVVPWLGALAVVLSGARRPRVRAGVAVGFAALAALGTAALLPFATAEVALRLPLGEPFGDLTFVPDGAGAFMAAICSVIGALVVLYSKDDLHADPALTRYFAFVLLFMGSMSALTMAGSLLLLVLCWELVGLCSFALIAHHADRPAALAGGVRALIVTQVGGIGLLIGALVARAYLGTYDVDALVTRSASLPGPVLTLIAYSFLVAAAAKSAQIPFHTWLPGAMEAPTPISALIHAATMVNAGVYLLARFQPAFADVPGWAVTVVVIGLASALLGALLVLVEMDLKRALAYSTVSQLGLMVLAIGVGSLFASQFHLLSHAIFKALLFLAAGCVIHAIGTRDLRRMGGLGRSLPFTRAVFVVGAMGLAGVPIANGFWSKDLIVAEAAAYGGWLLLGVLVATILSALYAFRLVWTVFYGRPGPASVDGHITRAVQGVVGALAAGTLLSWLLAGPLGLLLSVGLAAEPSTIPSTLLLVEETLTSPSTMLSLGATGLGLAAWWWRGRLGWLVALLRTPWCALADDGGFQRLNDCVVAATRELALALSRTQTGYLSWNVAGLVGAAIVLLALAAWGA